MTHEELAELFGTYSGRVSDRLKDLRKIPEEIQIRVLNRDPEFDGFSRQQLVRWVEERESSSQGQVNLSRYLSI